MTTGNDICLQWRLSVSADCQLRRGADSVDVGVRLADGDGVSQRHGSGVVRRHQSVRRRRPQALRPARRRLASRRSQDGVRPTPGGVQRVARPHRGTAGTGEGRRLGGRHAGQTYRRRTACPRRGQCVAKLFRHDKIICLTQTKSFSVVRKESLW